MKKFEKALHYLRTIVASSPIGTKLLTVEKLAGKAGVGLVTMSRAVRAFQKEGVLVCAPRKGICVKKHHELKTIINKTGTEKKWDQIRKLLLRDIMQVSHADTISLPSKKILQYRYHVNYRTLKKVLDSLINDGYLDYHGQTVKISPSGSYQKGSRIIIGTQASSPLILDLFNERNLEFYRILETECARRGLYPDLVSIDALREAPEHKIDEETLGIIIWNRESDPYPLLDLGNELKHRFKKSGVVLIDETGSDIPDSKGICIITAAGGLDPGRKMGLFLLRKGHRKVAFFSSVHKALWSQARLHGMMQAYVSAGIDDAVIPFVNSEFESPSDMVTDLHTFDSNKISFAEKKPVTPPGRFIDTINSLIPELIQNEIMIDKLRPLYSQAFENREITAWVAAEDLMAIGAQEFLKKKGPAAAHVKKLCGFDDSSGASLQKLTSFNFNMHAVAVNAMRMLDHSRWRKAAGTNKLIQIEGFITERS